tara:strand:- start:272 stop:427 length:156 start_codon:yes stop_codon:yes gene_type:complete
MNQRKAQKELKEIEKLAMILMTDKSSQTCGTEYQKWTYALLKARKEYHETK